MLFFIKIGQQMAEIFENCEEKKLVPCRFDFRSAFSDNYKQ
jgi:hypothetical protein